MPVPDDKLTAKQAAFVAEYLVDLNSYAAAIRAGYSPKTASSASVHILQKPKIKEAVEKALANRIDRTEITSDRVIAEIDALSQVDAADVAPIVDGVVKIKDTADWTPAQRAAVTEIKQDRHGAITLKMVDKLKAKELLGRHTGAFQPDTEINVGLQVNNLPPPLVIKGVSTDGRVTDGTHVSEHMDPDEPIGE